VAAEVKRRGDLAELGVDVAAWAPGIKMQAPKMVCPALQMKQRAAMPRRCARGQKAAAITDSVRENQDGAALEPAPKTPEAESPPVSVDFKGDSGRKPRQARKHNAASEEDHQHAPAKRLKSNQQEAKSRRSVKLPICNDGADEVPDLH